MINLSDCIWIGTITKLHGFRGQVILRLNNLNSGKIQEMGWVFIEIDGLPVPFFVSAFSHKDTGSMIINFDDVENEHQAEQLIDARLFVNSLPEIAIGEENSDIIEWMGYEVIDKNLGRLGIIKDVLDIQQNPLFCIIDNKKEILLPASPEFILNVDPSNKTIWVEAPEGLTDLP